MKNDDEMYQSVLSRRNEFREQKKKRLRTIKLTAPILACFFLAVGLAISYRDSFSKLLKNPQPDIINESQIVTEPTFETPESTYPSATKSTSAAQTTSISAVSTTVIASVTETKQTTSAQHQHSQTVTVHAPVSETAENTQLPVTTAPITKTKPITEVPTTSSVRTTAKPTKTTSAVSEPITTVTTRSTDIAYSPQPLTTTEPSEVSPIVQEPIDPDDPPAYEPSAPPARPISFDDIETAAYAIRNNDVSFYPEPAQYVYLSMFERIRNDNFLYQTSCSEFISLKEDFGICLFPNAKYEDMGIGHYVTYKEKIYHVTFYYTDPYVISETDSIGDYLKKRMGRRSDKEITIQDQTFSESITDDGRIYASSFIDADHYFDIVTSAPEDELMKFLSLFSYEKIPL